MLSEAVLFTEANVVLPTTLLDDRHQWLRVVRFWAIAWVGNLAGAWLFAQLIATAQAYSPETLVALGEVIERKLAYREVGGAGAWWQLVLSGVLASWAVALGWNIVPAGIGNMVGAAVLVAVPFWFVHHRRREDASP